MFFLYPKSMKGSEKTNWLNEAVGFFNFKHADEPMMQREMPSRGIDYEDDERFRQQIELKPE